MILHWCQCTWQTHSAHLREISFSRVASCCQSRAVLWYILCYVDSPAASCVLLPWSGRAGLGCSGQTGPPHRYHAVSGKDRGNDCYLLTDPMQWNHRAAMLGVRSHCIVRACDLLLAHRWQLRLCVILYPISENAMRLWHLMHKVNRESTESHKASNNVPSNMGIHKKCH